MTDRTDILIVNALKMELDAAASVLTALGVALEPMDYGGIPCSAGTLLTDGGPRRIVLARPTRMGSLSTATIAAPLVTQLRPTCLAMSGVCAGNPDDVALGDVIIAEIAYAYDEGKRTAKGFEGDHRPIPIADGWLRIAQETLAGGLPSFGAPTEQDRRDWLVEQLAFGGDPARHPARERYLDGERWGILVRDLEMAGIVVRKGERFVLTKRGRDAAAARRAYGSTPIAQLPFAIHAGPIASGNVVVKDGVTWSMLKAQGIRTVLGLEMEAAAIARIAHNHDVPRWIVAKGVMDYADPRKDDRFKPFAATAAAQVLMRFLTIAPLPAGDPGTAIQPAKPASNTITNLIGDVTGSGITINQIARHR